MEFNKYDNFFQVKILKNLYMEQICYNICEFEHEKRIIILTLKKEECMKIMKN